MNTVWLVAEDTAYGGVGRIWVFGDRTEAALFVERRNDTRSLPLVSVLGARHVYMSADFAEEEEQ